MSEDCKKENEDCKKESGDYKRENESRKREIRTQGKFSDMSKYKSRDKKQKNTPPAKELHEKKTHKRYSNESRGSNNSFVDDGISPVKYQDNSEYHFDQLEVPKKAIELGDPGKTVLSDTENGQSVIFYEPELLKSEEAWNFFERLESSINWYSKNIVIHGEEYPQPRLVAWFGPYPYSYSGTTLDPQSMPDCVLEIKEIVEEYLSKNGFNATFNSVLLNLYRNGKDSVAWHSDDEFTMGIHPTIASVSLGETRRFEMRFKKKYQEDESLSNRQDDYFINLTHGSLVVMDGCMQDDWQHRVPKEYHDREPRINLTFRTVYPIDQISPREPIKELKKKQVNEWISCGESSTKMTFDKDDFPPLISRDDFPPLKSVDDISTLKIEDSFPPLKYEDDILPLKRENDFSSLNNNVNPVSSHPYSDVRNFSRNSCNSSVRNDDLNSSNEYWDSETPSNEKVKAENDMPSIDNTCDSYFATNEFNKAAEKLIDDNDNSFEINSVENRLGNSLRSSDIPEEHVYNKKPTKKWLNVAAKEFVPKSPLFVQSPDYSKFPLSDLINYEVKLMSPEVLQDFAYNLKLRVRESLNEFSRAARDELEFLCMLTDGTQSEKNQKLISERMINMVMNNLNRQQTFSDAEKSYNRGPQRAFSYGKQNNFDKGRYYQSHKRAGAHRY